MPHYSFYQVHSGDRAKIAEAKLEDGEAARVFGIELAERSMSAQSPEWEPATSHIVICDVFGGDLDTIISGRFKLSSRRHAF